MIDPVHTEASIGFNPHAPCGARPRGVIQEGDQLVSIHTPHAERDKFRAVGAGSVEVSIHTPHAERDVDPPELIRFIKSFNPHAPCGARLNHMLGRQSIF